MKELLQLLRDYILTEADFEGMCRSIKDMYYVYDIITLEEKVKLFLFLQEDTFTLICPLVGYWWPRGEREPRLEWLDEKIKELN